MSVDRIISAESGGNPYAANPNSTARGLGQFIEATWLDMMARHRPDLITGMGRDQILNLRNDPALSRKMTEAYASENRGLLGKAGVPVTDGTAYLAHFAGPQGAIKVLQADPTAPVGSILGQSVVRANPFLANMTAGDLVGWADKKMGVKPQAVAQPVAQPAMPQPQGILGQAPVAQPQQGLLAQQSAPQAAPQPQGILAPQPQQSGMSPEEVAAFMAPPKAVQHLNIPMTPPRRGFAFKGYHA